MWWPAPLPTLCGAVVLWATGSRCDVLLGYECDGCGCCGAAGIRRLLRASRLSRVHLAELQQQQEQLERELEAEKAAEQELQQRWWVAGVGNCSTDLQ